MAPRYGTRTGQQASLTLDSRQLEFLNRARVARLATLGDDGYPHAVPVCYAHEHGNVYITVDQKPKTTHRLRRLRNIEAHPQVALVIDHYEEDWSQLGWLMLRGRAEVLADGAEHDRAQELLRERYRQYRSMNLTLLPVIAIRIETTNAWGTACDGGSA